MIIPIIAILLTYSGLLAVLLYGLAKIAPVPALGKPPIVPGVSIVIPFKNEAQNLEKLLTSLNSQLYEGIYEVILVNDCSTDNYKVATSQHCWSFPLRILDSSYSPDRELSSKQQALDLGIKSASFDWVALTDADMVLAPGWINSLVSAITGGASFIFGHTAMGQLPGRALFGWFQSFQLEVLFAVAYALHRAGISGSCMGNNLLLSRKAYAGCGGFDGIGYTMVEDRALLLAMRKNGYRIGTTEPFYPQATTMPCARPGHFASQLLRWARGGFRWNSNLALFAVVLACQNFAVMGATTGICPAGISVVAVINLLATWFFVAWAFRLTGSKLNGLLFPAFIPGLLLETVLLPLGLLFRREIIWKGRQM